MNKQELIEKYQRIYQVSNEPGYRSDPFSRGEDAGSSRCSFEIIDDLKKLDEPQKVKVPAFVAEWIEYVKKKGDRFFDSFGPWDLYGAEYVEADRWIAKNGETYARAWLDGYEIEEESKWVVRVKEMYFLNWGVDGTCPTFVIDDNPGAKLSAKPFIKREAQSLAESLHGSIEKV